MTEPTKPLVFDADFIDDIAKDEVDRKESINEFIQNMTRPDRVAPEDDNEDIPSVQGDKSDDDDNAEAASDDKSNTGSSEGKDTFNLFDFLELDNIAEWWEGALVFGSIRAHDYFDDSREIQQARERIVTSMSQGGLNEDQLKYLKARYDELGVALQEREDGRANLKEDLEFPDKIKAKFNQIFKKWFDTKSLNVDLSSGWALVLMALGMMMYSLVIVGKTRYSYRKV